ncbi:phage portal protein [Rickettsia endosymbiont of Orchestes rusci]|uniref:phage portal protein n=1 Tax=Rickettsia endosymbiont of Orchestes rusci TaxID=3066250 RepID=UPI00313D213E
MIRKYLKNIFKDQNRKSQSFIEFNNIAYSDLREIKVGIDAYRKNVIVYRCVNLIAQSVGHVPWKLMRNNNGNNEVIADHPLYHLLKRPNPEKAGADFFSELIAGKLLFGNSYILSTTDTKPPEIYLLHATATEVVLEQNQAIAYRYKSSNGEKIYPINPINKMSRVLHLKNYHPTNGHYGLSALDAASLPIDLHQQATYWNNALLRNGVRPSGALIVKDGNGYLSDEQFERLQAQLVDKFTGSNNSGKPLLLEGGLGWQEMSINPKDMDFIESKNSAAREIALAFGVPPQLLGINGDNTYSNMQEARLALWEETLIPLLDKLADALSNWFSHLYQEDIVIDLDRDNISALTEKRENLWAKIAGADFMTLNEKRAFVGLKPVAGGDNL